MTIKIKTHRNAADILQDASDTYRERNAVYGDNYKRVGKALAAFFPDGVTLRTSDDFDRFHIFALKVVKLSRYCVNWDKGGHQDSIHDDTVYGAMLEEIDHNIDMRLQVEMATIDNFDPDEKVEPALPFPTVPDPMSRLKKASEKAGGK